MKTYYSILIIFSCFLFSPGSSQTYWSENFGSGPGCNQAQLAASYSGSNGFWTVSQTGSNGIYANEWYISSTSSNSGAGTCDSYCPSFNNQSLHVGNVSGSPGSSLFCPTGDCGQPMML